MQLAEIKAALDAGQQVRWAHDGYHVIKDSLGQYLVTYPANGFCNGLTEQDAPDCYIFTGKELI